MPLILTGEGDLGLFATDPEVGSRTVTAGDRSRPDRSRDDTLAWQLAVIFVSVAAVVLGVTVVVLAAADLGLTVLHPSRRGLLSRHVEHLAWAGVRRLTRLGGRDRLLSFGGPAAMAADLLAWVFSLWLGFALIQPPSVHTFRYSPGWPGHEGFVEALYLSGASLTTVGFGDVVAGSEVLRLVTILEAASGLAVITAAIAYVTAVYPRVSLVRVAASWATDLQADTEEGAARFICHGGRDEVARLQRNLIEIHQDLLRFPVLYYFHAGVPGESTASLLRAAALVCTYLRYGLAWEAVPFAALYGPGLERTLERLLDDYAREFRGAHLTERSLDQHEAHARLHRLREDLRRVAPESVSSEPGVPPDLARFLAHIDTFLLELGRVHRHSAAPLFGER
ncbi:ion channel [Euzebya sp.]|uniref:potassium channel family protein n=1 Tax=Euzebya sp. TaxID=1971409 RepID=UPI003515D0C9